MGLHLATSKRRWHNARKVGESIVHDSRSPPISMKIGIQQQSWSSDTVASELINDRLDYSGTLFNLPGMKSQMT